jgi:tetratricopeptide (TPR) repeat protein
VGAHFDRALVLFRQSRPDLAERELQLELAADPEAASAHALLALCFLRREEYAKATTEARAAIRLAPDSAYPHYVHGVALKERNRFDEALSAAREAIRLDPEDPDYHALVAAIRLDQRRWKEAAAAAEGGLALDAEHVDCNNFRAVALVKLGRRAEAAATIQEALRKDPGNATTHGNQGWAFLENGEPRRALEHFREALRLEPSNEWARQGLIEAMKARNVIYALLLRYFLWMAKLSGQAQWGIVIGGYLGARVLTSVAKRSPELEPWITPVLILYTIFCLMTWTAGSLFNLLLRLDRFGRHALSQDEVLASNCVGACYLLGLAFLVAFLFSHVGALLTGALMFGFLTIPVAATFHCEKGRPRRIMGSYTTILAVIGVVGLCFLLFGREDDRRGSLASSGITAVFFLGLFLSQWIGNLLMQTRVKK